MTVRGLLQIEQKCSGCISSFYIGKSSQCLPVMKTTESVLIALHRMYNGIDILFAKGTD